jgi:hypothetical protein
MINLTYSLAEMRERLRTAEEDVKTSEADYLENLTATEKSRMRYQGDLLTMNRLRIQIENVEAKDRLCE